MYENLEKNQNKLLELLNRADYYKGINDYQSAIDCYEIFLKIDNSKASVCTICADLYSKLNGSKSLKRQIELYTQAYKLENDNRLALHGLAFGYEKLGQNDQAKMFYEKLLQNNPTENDYFNYGAFLIHCGDFENGHKYFAHRFNIDDINLKYPSDINRKWDFKSDISDKTLLVHYEQGFGDSIMYSRFVPFLKKIAQKVIFAVQGELLSLFSDSEIFEGIDIVSSESGVDYDVNMALLDAPLVLDFDSDNLPFTSKYLDVSEDLVKYYKEKFLDDEKVFRVGISSKGEASANYNDRNIEISKIIDLFNGFSDTKLYNLNKTDEMNDRIINLGRTFDDFKDSSCAIKNMDLIISTDNVILNLAGALGVKTFALFNKETNYRWFKTNGDNAGWYNNVKPFQNEKQNEWNGVLNSVLEIIKKSDIIQ